MFPITQMFLVLDHQVLPKHIQETFKLHLKASGSGWESDLTGIDVALMGDDINMSAGGYVVVYAQNTWHAGKAGDLYDQIKSLRRDAIQLVIPVEVEVKTQGDVFALPSIESLAWSINAKP